MERRWLCVSVLAALVLCPVLVVYAATGEADRVSRPLTSMDFWIDPFSGKHYRYTNCMAGGHINGSFEVTSGSGVDFFICDEANYEKWTSLLIASVYERHDSVASLSFDFRVPEYGTWYVVFWSDDFVNSVHIEGTIYYTVPASSLNSLLLEVAMVLTGSTLCIGFGWLLYREHVKTQKLKQSPSSSASAGPAYMAPAQPSPAGYCPSCGAPRNSPQDKFCPSCGKPLTSGPELG